MCSFVICISLYRKPQNLKNIALDHSLVDLL
jgi:hypothetical protein